MRMTVRIQEADFVAGDEIDALRAELGGELGGLSLFCGLVRDRHGSERVDALGLEHYPGMTEASIERIVERAGQRWPLRGMTVIHRVGWLRPADQIVLVLAASGHRQAALDATAFVMDYLKTDAIFWKKERLGNRERWVESRADDHDRVRRWELAGAACRGGSG